MEPHLVLDSILFRPYKEFSCYFVKKHENADILAITSICLTDIKLILWYIVYIPFCVLNEILFHCQVRVYSFRGCFTCELNSVHRTPIVHIIPQKWQHCEQLCPSSCLNRQWQLCHNTDDNCKILVIIRYSLILCILLYYLNKSSRTIGTW